jgi:hypothetical protein
MQVYLSFKPLPNGRQNALFTQEAQSPKSTPIRLRYDQYWKIYVFIFNEIGYYASIHDQIIAFLTNLNETFDFKRAVILLFIIQVGHQHALNESYLLKMHGGMKFQAHYCVKEDDLCMNVKHELGALSLSLKANVILIHLHE